MRTVGTACVCLLGVAFLAAAEPAAKLPLKPVSDAAAITERLGQRVTLDPAIERLPLKDVLEFLGKQYGLTLLIDPLVDQELVAAQARGGAAATGLAAAPALAALAGVVLLQDSGFADQPVSLPVMRDVRVGTVLNQLARQVRCRWLIDTDHLRLTRFEFAIYETGEAAGPSPNEDESPLLVTIGTYLRVRPLTQRALVNLSGDKPRPLAELLAAVTDSTGANVVLAPQAKEQGQTPLAVRLTNAPVEAVVRTLAEMAGLEVVADANVLLVTTPERAKAIEERKAARKVVNFETDGMGCAGGGGDASKWQPKDLSRRLTLGKP
jgi:hypothetical protein